MMVEKESGRLVRCEFPSLWTEEFEEGKRTMKMYAPTLLALVFEHRLMPLFQIP